MAKLLLALNKALAAADVQPQDTAAVALARRYAEQIDEPGGEDTLGDLGPKLLAVLTSLGLTPAGRGVKEARRGSGPRTPANPLDELRARRSTS